MNRYFLIRRLTGPLILLLLGVVALLHQVHRVHWGIFVPLLLILLGVLKLAERAAFEADGAWRQPYPGVGQPTTIHAAGSATAVQNSVSEPQGGQP